MFTGWRGEIAKVEVKERMKDLNKLKSTNRIISRLIELLIP